MKSLLLKLIIPSILILFASASPLAADQAPQITYIYYEVNINDESPIIFQMLKATPIVVDGRKLFSRTMCQNSYTLNSGPKDAETCQINEYSLNTVCEVSLPRFGGLADKYRPQLDRYLEKAKDYELEHVNINVEHLKKFKTELDSRNTYACNQLETAVKDMFSRVSSQIKAAEKNLAEATFDGRTRGADIEWHLALDEERLLMADENAVSEAQTVEPAMEYLYKETPLSGETADRWRDQAGRLKWDVKLDYKPRRKADGTCRVLYYYLESPCQVILPQYIGARPDQEQEMASFIEEIKGIYSDNCRIGAQRATELAAKISGANTFNCETMVDDIAALVKETEQQTQSRFNALTAAYMAPQSPAGKEPAARLTPKVKRQYYDVQVTDTESALKAAWASTRLLVDQKASLSATALEMDFKYHPERIDKSKCRITQPDIGVSCTLHLPRFKSKNPDDKAALAAVEKKIEAAEMKRCEIAVNQAEALREQTETKNFPCPAIGNHAQILLNRTIEETKKQMNEYQPNYEH